VDLVDAPGATILPRATWAGFAGLWWHCVSFGLKSAFPSWSSRPWCRPGWRWSTWDAWARRDPAGRSFV